MLLKERGIFISQKEICDIIGEPTTLESLAKFMNQIDISSKIEKWHGTATDEDGLEILLKRKNWAVILREPMTMGHAVFVDGVAADGLIKIKDPFDQTAYKMTKSDFLKHWGGEVIFYGEVT